MRSGILVARDQPFGRYKLYVCEGNFILRQPFELSWYSSCLEPTPIFALYLSSDNADNAQTSKTPETPIRMVAFRSLRDAKCGDPTGPRQPADLVRPLG